MMMMYLAQGMAFMMLVSARSPLTIFLASAWVGLNFGGNFALFPSATSDYFGSKHFGINYGWIFTAYGVAGILGPVVGGVLFDATQELRHRLRLRRHPLLPRRRMRCRSCLGPGPRPVTSRSPSRPMKRRPAAQPARPDRAVPRSIRFPAVRMEPRAPSGSSPNTDSRWRSTRGVFAPGSIRARRPKTREPLDEGVGLTSLRVRNEKIHPRTILNHEFRRGIRRP